MRASFCFLIISTFLKSRKRKCPLFSLLGNLITHLYENVPPNLWKNEKKNRRLVSSVGRAPDCRGFETQAGPTLRVLK